MKNYIVTLTHNEVIKVIADNSNEALHKAYSAEHMRGEWFNLTAKDVQEITQTLA